MKKISFNQQVRKAYKYLKMVNGQTPVFSQFGNNIYASDVVQQCIDIIASECSKLQPRHIRTTSDDTQTTPVGSINRLFKFAPNELMTTHDFLEKVIWLLYLNYNCFIYPMFKVSANGKREYTGFYPLNPTSVTFLQDQTNKIFVKMRFAGGGESPALPYSDLIHLRKKFSVNEVMGGGANGQPDNAALLKVLGINDTVLQGIEKGVKSSLQIYGIVNIKTMLDDGKQEKERERFEQKILNNESGILAADLKGDYIPLTVNPKLVDKDTLDFLQDKILNNYGVSVPIFTGKFTDEEYQAFYEKTLEPIVISLGQAFSKALFSQTGLDHGNEIVFYQKNMMYLSTKSKLELLKTAGEQGILTNDQKLMLMGYPPIGGEYGKKITQSLNFIDVKLIDKYQMNKSIGSSKEEK